MVADLATAACAYLHLGAPMSPHPPLSVQEFRCSAGGVTSGVSEVLYAPSALYSKRNAVGRSPATLARSMTRTSGQ